MNESHQKNPTRYTVDFGKTHSVYEMNSRHIFQEVRKYQDYEAGQEIFFFNHQEVNESENKVITETIEQGQRV